MWSSSRIVLVTLVSLLSLLSSVQSDSKSFPYNPALISSVAACTKDVVYVQFLVDSSSINVNQYSYVLNYANNIASGLLAQNGLYKTNIIAALYHYRGSSIISGTTGATTAAQFTTAVQTLLNSWTPPTGATSNTVSAISGAITQQINGGYITYPRRVIYVITGNSPSDYSNWISGTKVSKSVENYGVEVFVEAVNVNYAQSQVLVNIAAAPTTNHFINSTSYNSLTSAGRAISAIRRDIGGTCSVFSGSNFITYDGISYTPQTTGYSVLTQTLFSTVTGGVFDPRIRTFTVVANPGVSDVTITTSADTVRFVWAKGELTTTLNGAQITLGPGDNAPGETSIYASLSQLSAGSLGMVVNVTSSSGDLVQLGFYDNPYIMITPNYDLFGHLVGLCGTLDSCAANEFIGPNGITDQKTFVNAWAVPSYTYNTALWAGTSSPYGSQVNSSLADAVGSNGNCAGIQGYLQKLCSYDVGASGANAAAIYYSIQASACENYCQSGVLTVSYLNAGACNQYCLSNYPPIDLHNVTDRPINFYDVQTTAGQKMYAQVYLGGTYVVKATDPAGIVDYTSLQFNCSGKFDSVSAGNGVTVTRNPQLGFPYVQLKGSLPAYNRPIQITWKALSYPYIGMNDNTTSQAVIAAQAPLILSGTSITPRFVPTLPGVYTFELAAYDGCQVVTSTVSVTAVCDTCLFTSRVAPTPTVFYEYPGSFDQASYSASVYAAPLYPTPNVDWNVSNFVPYNVRNENLTWVAVDSNDFVVTLTTGTTGHATINTSTLPASLGASASYQQPQAFNPSPITINDHVVIDPVPAIIEKHYIHEFDYYTYSQTSNTVAVPIESFEVSVVCQVRLNENGLGSTVSFTPTVPQVADYCTGTYNISLFASDICHNSTDVFRTQVNCNSRPIINAPDCKGKVLQVYDPLNGWVPTVLDGTTPYDTEENYLQFYYNWTLINKPLLSNLNNPGCTTGSCSILPDTAGNYVYTYTVSDGCRTEQVTYTLTAQCYNMAGNQLRFIQQIVQGYPAFNFDGSGRQTISFFDNSTLALNAVYTTTVAPLDPGLANLPVFNKQYQNVYHTTAGNFRPTYGGDWLLSYSTVDDCGALAQSPTPVKFVCPAAVGSVIAATAVVTPSITRVETSGPNFPFISFDGSQSSVTGAAYNSVGQYWWYYRPQGSTNVADWQQINSFQSTLFWAPPSAGNWQVLLIYTDGCMYASTITVITAACDQAIPAFEIDQILHNFVNDNGIIFDTGRKTVNGGFVFYGPNTQLTLNASATQNGSYFLWNVVTNHGDVYSYNTYSVANPTFSQTTLYLQYPAMQSGFTVNLATKSQCPGAVWQNISQSVSTSCDQDWINDPVGSVTFPQRNNWISQVTFTPDVSSVSFQQSNRFDSVTFTANNVLPQYVYFTKFLITAAPSDSIYAPVVQTTTTAIPNVVTTIGHLNNTDFTGQYVITTTTTTTVVQNSWVWVAINEVAGNSSYKVCFTPDVSGTYTISAEIRDLCNNTYKQSVTITANCQVPIQFGDEQDFSVDTRNFRDLARVTIDASKLNNPTGSDLKFRWSLSAANGSYAQPYNGTYYTDAANTGLTNWYGSIVSFVLPYTTYNNTYYAHYDIWDGCQMRSGDVNVTVLATSHRPIFVDSVAAPVPNSTDQIKVNSKDSVVISDSTYLKGVQQYLRMTDCYSANIDLEVANFQAYQAPPPAKPAKKSNTGVIVGAVVGSVVGAAIIAGAIFGIMKYKARSVAV